MGCVRLIPSSTDAISSDARSEYYLRLILLLQSFVVSVQAGRW